MTLALCRTKNIVQLAVQKRNSEALSAMTFAATLGDVDSMEHLLQRGLLINTADYDGRTTLHLAALEGNVKVLELLLQEGADPNVRDRCARNTLYGLIVVHPDLTGRVEVGVHACPPDLHQLRTDACLSKREACVAGFLGGLNDEAQAGTGSCRWGHTPLQHAVSRRHGPAIEVMQKYDARLG